MTFIEHYCGVTRGGVSVHSGSLTGPVEKSFVYDDEGRMISQGGAGAKAIQWNQSGNAANINGVTYVYDPLGYRIGSSAVGDYYLDGEHLEAIYSGSQLQAKYFRGIGTDELLAGFGYVNGAWTPAIYQQDALMSVTGISSHDGNPVWSADYTAFGDRLIGQTGTSANRLQYTGREMDSTGLYYYRARYYDPTIGRFLSEDPLGFAAGINFYAYVNNNPINANDPSGLDPSQICPAQSCQAALAVAGANNTALARATANWGTIQSAAATNGIAPALLAAIGVRETGFRNIAQTGGGQGAGVFQIDLGKNPNVTSSQAYDIPFAANFAANMLATNETRLAAAHPNLSPTQLLQATAASYNFGTPNISGNPNTIDIGSSGGNYGSNVLGLMACFQACSASTTLGSVTAASNSASAAAGGFLLYPNKPNTNQMQGVYRKY
ncbi:MAG: hypothetical protein K2P57_06015 [Burkholderiales bacterium]|nr:hypothetical protein [Burkholderiales bacterium]